MTNCSSEHLAASPLVLLCQDALINYLENTDSLYFCHETRHPKTKGKNKVEFFFLLSWFVRAFENRMHYLFLFYLFTFLYNVIAGKPTLVSESSFILFLIRLLETNPRLSL